MKLHKIQISVPINKILKKSLSKDMFIDFREMKGGEEGERERERDIDWLTPVCTLTGERTCNLGMCLDYINK